MIKLDIYNNTGSCNCIHHGIHDEWVIKSNDKRALECRKCIRERTSRYYKNNPEYQDVYRFSRNGFIIRLLNSIKKRSVIKNIPYELNIDWFNDTIERQNNKCAYSGIEFDFYRINKYKEKRYYIPSVDQVVAGKGYTLKNSILVCSVVNIMKNNINLDTFRIICYKIANKI